MNWKGVLYYFGLPAVLVLAALKLFAILYGDWLWFQHMGFSQVFTTSLGARALVFSAAFIFFVLFFGVNIRIARRGGEASRALKPASNRLPTPFISTLFSERRVSCWWGVGVLIFSIAMGWQVSNGWLLFLKHLYRSQFGVSDPVLLKDAGFYVYSLPLYYFFKKWCTYALFFSACGVVASYHLDGVIKIQTNRIVIRQVAKIHLTVFAGLAALLMAWSYRLKIYRLMVSNGGVAWGAGYTDIHARIPACWILMALCLLIALLFFLMPVLKKWKWVAGALAVYIVFLFGGAGLYPKLVARYVVKPNEIEKETRYIEDTIQFTRLGYDLDNTREAVFQTDDTLSLKGIGSDNATIENIRLWDHRPLIQTYKQLQEIRLYYDFKNVDMDRYTIQNRYTEVAVAGRELPVSKLPDRAKTWVNTHLVYTHGYGIVMSPVNDFTSDGMPSFIVKDIPPISDAAVDIERPEIYYGEQSGDFAIVNTKAKEFDYPKGDRNVYTSYQGTGGVALSSLFRRAVYSLNRSDVNILMSDSITAESRIMMHRTISKREQRIAPFLTYDSDPYLVVGENGRLYWINDAYTTTGMFPYSQPVSGDKSGINYIRNSVEVVMDAYNGDVSYYVADPSDPLVQTYRKIFPTLFKPMEEFPAFLKSHLRYPQDLFLYQVKIYAAYHMTDPQVFYNQEDLWSIPQGGDDTTSMSPYYIVMKLPDADTEEFILMLPMTPSKKDNMIAWMCARCDGENRGQLLVYMLPKDKLVYGPKQIEARINQEPGITSEMTLWGQIGSNVIRGNLVIVPVSNSFMYVEPIYLQSKAGQMPQLKRVIAVHGEQLEMEKNLDAALKAILSKENVQDTSGEKADKTRSVAPLRDMAQEALGHYGKASEYLNQGDWGQYGKEMEQTRALLQKMTDNQ